MKKKFIFLVIFLAFLYISYFLGCSELFCPFPTLKALYGAELSLNFTQLCFPSETPLNPIFGTLITAGIGVASLIVGTLCGIFGTLFVLRNRKMMKYSALPTQEL